MKKHYYFNVSFALEMHRNVSAIVKHKTPRMTANRIAEVRRLLELPDSAVLMSVDCLGLMTEKQWNEEI